ncbi:DUF2095 family protein [Archaeoglobus neptunius]|uniref:DUF2095 family protein n=1 Tax=Archaeoglobus neptunius TaxID=2798580 RepID=UPI00192962B6|nr:DUF2095 family protein [Archaeoglobus neptunius]
MEWKKEKFKKMFPDLFHEIEGRTMPTVVDHLEVCKTVDEAVEVIDFFERKGEISREYANFLRSNPSLLKSLIGTRERGEYTRRGLGD